MTSPAQVRQTVKPLLSREQVSRILSERQSVTSDEAHRQMATHLQRPLLPGRKLIHVNGRSVLACC